MIPKECGLPPLTCNIEGLKNHAFISAVFIKDELSPQARKWRSWLIHCLVKAARHYDKSRDLVLAQLNEFQRIPDQNLPGNLLPILDFPYEMEDCITSTHKAVVCIEALAKHILNFRQFATENLTEKAELRSFRNQQEHMQNQIAAGQTGDGPILVVLSEDGHQLQFRQLQMSVIGLHKIIVSLYKAMAGLFPNFDINSPALRAGVAHLSMTATIEVTDSQGKTTIID